MYVAGERPTKNVVFTTQPERKREIESFFQFLTLKNCQAVLLNMYEYTLLILGCH